MGKCQYNKDWEQRKDINGYFVREWGRKESNFEMYCKMCMRKFSIQGGFQAVMQHAASNKHKTECRSQLNPHQLVLSTAHPFTSTSTSSDISQHQSKDTLQLFLPKDNAYIAELMWVMKCIQSNYSFNSCSDIEEIFRAMFPTVNAVPRDFTLGATKATYLLTDALAPYFRQALIKDISNAYFTLCYDETTNAAGAKELQIAVRYWSESQCKVLTQHLYTYLIGHAKAADIIAKLYQAMDDANLPRLKLLMLGSDGPYVNKKVEKKINDDIYLIRSKKLVDIGTCNIHIVHNAYLKGMTELGDDASDFIFRVHHFFKSYPARWEDFEAIQTKLGVPTHRFIKHVSSRWLTLKDSAERMLEQFDALQNYFLIYAPKYNPNLTKTKIFQSIAEELKRPTLKAELFFVMSSATLFTKITGMFQRDEPLIHLLYSELESLVQKLIGRSCKPEAVKNLGISEEVFKNENLLSVNDVKCSDEVIDSLSKENRVSEKERRIFLSRAQAHYIAAAKHILRKSALQCKSLVKYCRFLHPDHRLSERSGGDIANVARVLPLDIKVDVLLDEWLLLQAEKEVPVRQDRPITIDKYWNYFFELKTDGGDVKYPTVSAVVKATLSLSHGNAYVERGFSDSGRTLTKDRTCMCERTLNATMTVSSALKRYNNQIVKVPITPDLIALARCAHGNYTAYLEQQRKEKEKIIQKKVEDEERRRAEQLKRNELEAEKRHLIEDETKIIELRKEEKEKRATADRLYIEAQERLKKATQKKSFEEIRLAQGIFDGMESWRKQADEVKKQLDKLTRSVEKRKSTLISNMDAIPSSSKRLKH